jgi:hypothetical protein
MVGVSRVRWPAGRVARTEEVGAILLDHSLLARKHVEELALLFVPVPVGRARPRLQGLDVGDELGQPARLRKVQRLAGAVHLVDRRAAIWVLLSPFFRSMRFPIHGTSEWSPFGFSKQVRK